MLILIQLTILVTLFGTVVVFSPPSMFGFFELGCQKEKINTGREGAQVRVQHRVSQLNETRIVGLG